MGNLGDQVSEQELAQLFGAQPGFVTLKVVRNAKNATAFVDFADLAAAMAVHDSQQVGSLLPATGLGVKKRWHRGVLKPDGKNVHCECVERDLTCHHLLSSGSAIVCIPEAFSNSQQF